MAQPLTGGIDRGNDDVETECSAHTLYSFKDLDTVLEMVESLPKMYKNIQECEKLTERLIFIIDRYQEQPHLLDPHLETVFIKILAPIVGDDNCPADLIHISFTFLHPFIKVRGYKRATRYFPHDVGCLERVLLLLESQNRTSFSTWATRYCLLLWLSVVAIVPFDLERFARADDRAGNKFLVRLIEVGKTYLLASDISQGAAAVYLSKLFDRVDAKKEGLSGFIEWACERMQSQCDPLSDLPARIIYGLLRSLGLLFKHGTRADLSRFSNQIFELVTALRFMQSPDILIRKLYNKLIQRLCLVFMKKTVQTWRYERGHRVLAQAQNKVSGTNGNQMQAPKGNDQEQDSAEQLDEKSLPLLEKTIAQLIASLGDKDGVVRWSAAKGLARICSRLPVDMAEQVINTVMSLFSARLSAGGWHGASLVMAEFARRGLLRQTLLVKVVPLVSQGLFYDEVQGSFALGAHVRDAACYVCWAFARAYRPADLAPYVKELGSNLVIVMLFDREIQVRRAAAAAFQENVGRQGQFHLGIDILSICDYFAVGSIKSSYLELAPAVVSLSGSKEYLEPFFDHLVEVKLGHWDEDVRNLAAKSLAKLMQVSSNQEDNIAIIQSLVNEVGITNDQCRAHGLLCALSECLPLLDFKSHEQAVMNSLFTLFGNISNRPLCKGLKGEIIRHAICRLIGSICQSKLAIKPEFIDLWLKLASNYFREYDLILHDSAATAVRHVLIRASDIAESNANDFVDGWIEEARTTSFHETRSGLVKGLAHLPLKFMTPRLQKLTSLLVTCCSITEVTLFWTGSRVASLKAISSIFESLDPEENCELLIDCCSSCLEDYTSDERGDVAACVREQAAHTLMQVFRILAEREKPPKQMQVDFIMSSLAGQCCEKICRTRLNAAHCLLNILRDENSNHLNIPNREELLTIFAEVPLPPAAAVIASAMSEWSETETFCRFSKLLPFNGYSNAVLRGLLISCGDLTESLSQASFLALSNYIQNLDSAGIRSLFDQILSLLADSQKSPEALARLATPIVKSIDCLLTGGSFDEILEQQSVDDNDELISRLYIILNKLSKSKNYPRVIAVSKLLCSLLTLPLGCPLPKHPASRPILVLLLHPYPRVRSQTASALFEAISLSPPDECDGSAVCQLLSDTDWANLPAATKAYNDLCRLVNVTPGKVLKA